MSPPEENDSDAFPEFGSEDTESEHFQRFQPKDGTPLASLSTQLCAETGEPYFLWSEVQRVFESVDHLHASNAARVMFMIDEDGDLYVYWGGGISTVKVTQRRFVFTKCCRSPLLTCLFFKCVIPGFNPRVLNYAGTINMSRFAPKIEKVWRRDTEKFKRRIVHLLSTRHLATIYVQGNAVYLLASKNCSILTWLDTGKLSPQSNTTTTDMERNWTCH